MTDGARLEWGPGAECGAGCDEIRTRIGCGLGFGAALALAPLGVPWRRLRPSRLHRDAARASRPSHPTR